MAHFAPRSLAPADGFVLPGLSQRAAVFAGIVAFHIVLIYVFASGLAASTMKLVLQPTQVEFLPNVPHPDHPPLPPPAPNLQQPVVDLGPPPDVPLNFPPDTTTLTAPVRETVPPVVSPQPAHVEPIRLVGRNQLPNSEDYYPPALRRLGVEGATSVRVCVDENGRRDGEPTVTESSGNARLDDGALAVVRAGRFARAKRGDTFVPNCYGFRVIFKMRQE